MLNRSASLAMSTSVLKALPGKLDHLVFSIYTSHVRIGNVLDVRCSFVGHLNIGICFGGCLFSYISIYTGAYKSWYRLYILKSLVLRSAHARKRVAIFFWE